MTLLHIKWLYYTLSDFTTHYEGHLTTGSWAEAKKRAKVQSPTVKTQSWGPFSNVSALVSLLQTKSKEQRSSLHRSSRKPERGARSHSHSFGSALISLLHKGTWKWKWLFRIYALFLEARTQDIGICSPLTDIRALKMEMTFQNSNPERKASASN